MLGRIEEEKQLQPTWFSSSIILYFRIEFSDGPSSLVCSNHKFNFEENIVSMIPKKAIGNTAYIDANCSNTPPKRIVKYFQISTSQNCSRLGQ